MIRKRLTGLKTDIFFGVLAIIVILLALTPYARNGLWADDALNSQVYFGLTRLNQGLLSFSYDVFNHWLVHDGRLMAGFLYGYPLFYLFNDSSVLRLAHCLSVILSMLAWSQVLRRCDCNWNIIIVWCVVLVGMFQINGSVIDPIAAFAFHYQLLTIQLAICLLLFFWAIEDISKSGRLLVTLTVWFAFMLSYEINVVFIPICFVLLFDRYRLKASTQYAYLLIFLFLYLSVAFLFRYYSVQTYDGVAFGLGSIAFTAFLKQLSGSLPAAIFIFNDYVRSDLYGLLLKSIESFISWAVFLLSFVVLLYSTKRASASLRLATFTSRQALLLSGLMALLPAMLPAISVKYQSQLEWGVSTLPVYYQWIGVSYLIAFMFSLLVRKGVLHVIVVFAFATYMALNVTQNQNFVNQIDASWRMPREALREFSKTGGFKSVQDGDVLLLEPGIPSYINSNYIYEISSLNVYIPSDDHFWFKEFPSSNALVFQLGYSDGQFALSKIKVAHEWGKGWSTPEIGHRWAEASSADIFIDNYSSFPVDSIMKFEMRGLSAQNISVFVNDVFVHSFLLEPSSYITAAIPLEFRVGRSFIRLSSDVLPVSPGNGDPRSLTFDLVRLRFE